MKIFIVDGNTDGTPGNYRDRIDSLASRLSGSGHTTEVFTLAGKNIHGCTGCFSCWLRTPGVCVFKDDGTEFLRKVLYSDLVLFVSPLVMGFPTALMKNAIDRFIPLALPFIEQADGECRHPLRYDRSPFMAFLYEPEPDTDEEDLDIVTYFFTRFARNAHTRFVFAMPLSSDPEEVRHAVEGL